MFHDICLIVFIYGCNAKRLLTISIDDLLETHNPYNEHSVCQFCILMLENELPNGNPLGFY